MVLFSSDKEIIFKITNAVLLIWLVAAIAIAFSSVIRIVVKEPVRNYTYEEFKVTSCSYFKEDLELTEDEKEQRCLVEFNNQKFSNENSDYYKYITLYTSIANVLIVGGVMYFINRPKKEKIA
jgi:hypothetical protein